MKRRKENWATHSFRARNVLWALGNKCRAKNDSHTCFLIHYFSAVLCLRGLCLTQIGQGHTGRQQLKNNESKNIYDDSVTLKTKKMAEKYKLGCDSLIKKEVKQN